MQGQLLVRRLHNGLKKRGAAVSQTKWSSDCYKKEEKEWREREREQNNVNGFKKCNLFSNFCTERVVFDCLKDKFLKNFYKLTGWRLNPPCGGKKEVID